MSVKPWLNGKPYYCALCGLGMGEYLACEEVDCELESVEVAEARAAANEGHAYVDGPYDICRKCGDERLAHSDQR
jgi:hypothetical protein